MSSPNNKYKVEFRIDDLEKLFIDNSSIVPLDLSACVSNYQCYRTVFDFIINNANKLKIVSLELGYLIINDNPYNFNFALNNDGLRYYQDEAFKSKKDLLAYFINNLLKGKLAFYDPDQKVMGALQSGDAKDGLTLKNLLEQINTKVTTPSSTSADPSLTSDKLDEYIDLLLNNRPAGYTDVYNIIHSSETFNWQKGRILDFFNNPLIKLNVKQFFVICIFKELNRKCNQSPQAIVGNKKRVCKILLNFGIVDTDRLVEFASKIDSKVFSKISSSLSIAITNTPNQITNQILEVTPDHSDFDIYLQCLQSYGSINSF